MLAGPCGPDPWYVEVGEDDDPVEVVGRLAANLLGPPLLVHSTSWRRARGSVILSFIVVIGDDQARSWKAFPSAAPSWRAPAPVAAPTKIATSQAIEHGLRHLAWLAKEDPVVGSVLSEEWKQVLAGYVPEPFQHI